MCLRSSGTGRAGGFGSTTPGRVIHEAQDSVTLTRRPHASGARTMTRKSLGYAAAVERQTALNVAALVDGKHVCDTCGDVRDTAASAATCVERGTPTPDGPYHHRKSTRTIERKRFRGGALASAYARQSIDTLFSDD